MRRFLIAAIVVLSCAISVQAQAKISDPVWQAISNTYRSAVWSEQLESANKDPDPANFRSFVVVMVSDMAAERADRFISWGNYDYRAVKINAAKGTVKNRRGKAYTFLQPGDVMAVAGLNKLGDTVSIKLISPDIYMPLNREKDKKFSRVTDTVQIKLPKAVAGSDDPSQALSMMAQFIKPFPDMRAAQRFSPSVRRAAPVTAVTQ